jgi:polar amino acid transport system substrate-binding protein
MIRILGISFSADLFEDMEFTERYFTSSVGLLVAQDNKQIENISDLSEKIVSLQRGTVEYSRYR